ncbi:hypothetical protein Pla100_26420 [Neorhodopirellula pilleata]|uniref:Uncharacterized protein n=1 Tax=Neorhodopirellula pilleata TaxID=2714738 RepID=A0A5C6ADU9_9BACT|nr:hypothetical protein Pla100_26420 [Neorhodopirellula pilleata]
MSIPIGRTHPRSEADRFNIIRLGKIVASAGSSIIVQKSVFFQSDHHSDDLDDPIKAKMFQYLAASNFDRPSG